MSEYGVYDLRFWIIRGREEEKKTILSWDFHVKFSLNDLITLSKHVPTEISETMKNEMKKINSFAGK